MVRWMMNCEGLGRKRSLSDRRTALSFAWRDKGRLLKLRIAGVPAEIRTEHVTNASADRYRYTNQLGRMANIARWSEVESVSP
jgi:hypothetical protein